MSELIRPAPLLRRLAAASYDLLLLIALWMLAAWAVVLAGGGVAPGSGDRLFQGLLLAIALVFNGWFWTHGGQTLGMRAWRIQVRKEGGGPVGWGRSAWRFLVALPAWGLAGAGIWWQLLHPERKTWQDLLSGTETILLPPPKAPFKKKPPTDFQNGTLSRKRNPQISQMTQIFKEQLTRKSVQSE